jgi:hypothetical protein
MMKFYIFTTVDGLSCVANEYTKLDMQMMGRIISYLSLMSPIQLTRSRPATMARGHRLLR